MDIICKEHGLDMNKLKAYYALCRPMTSVAGAFAVIVGGVVAAAVTGDMLWRNVVLASFATLLTAGSSNAWNDCLDIEIDRVNQPKRVLPSGRLSEREAWIFSLVMMTVALILALLISPIAFLVVAVCNILLYLYSWKLKSTVLIGNASIGIISAMTVILGGVAVGDVTSVLSIALSVAVINFGREILKTMADYEGDLSQQVSTVATVWGQKTAQNLFLIVFIAALGVLMIPWLTDQFSSWYLLILVTLIYPGLIYVMTQTRHNAPPQKLYRMSKFLKLEFFVWFAAVIAGA